MDCIKWSHYIHTSSESAGWGARLFTPGRTYQASRCRSRALLPPSTTTLSSESLSQTLPLQSAIMPRPLPACYGEFTHRCVLTYGDSPCWDVQSSPSWRRPASNARHGTGQSRNRDTHGAQASGRRAHRSTKTCAGSEDKVYADSRLARHADNPAEHATRARHSPSTHHAWLGMLFVYRAFRATLTLDICSTKLMRHEDSLGRDGGRQPALTVDRTAGGTFSTLAAEGPGTH